MCRVKFSEAIGPVLDWMVAWCEDQATPADLSSAEVLLYRSQATNAWMYPKMRGIAYSTNWAQGGPIIEREGILLRPLRRPGHSMDGQWLAMFDGENTGTMVQWVKRTDWHRHYWSGDTPLIAAMRCFVSSKLGDEVETPEGFNHA